MEKIVVGVDCSPHSAAALRWAAADGAAKNCPVVAVRAWNYLDQRRPDGSEEFDPHWSAAKAKDELDQFVSETLGDAADGVQTEVVNDLPARALLAAAQDASTIVVGARGLGGFKGLLVGSVSRQITEHSPCTAVVARNA